MVRKATAKSFLQQLKEEKHAVTVFLQNGIKLQGVMVGLDTESVLLRRDGHTQLIYKHAISTIMPVEAIPFLDKK